jgi:hypothetical protein
MKRVMQGGWLDGEAVRRARVAGPCKNGPCRNRIEVGDLYVEGELDPYRAGGFAVERYCLTCQGTGDETRRGVPEEVLA